MYLLRSYKPDYKNKPNHYITLISLLAICFGLFYRHCFYLIFVKFNMSSYALNKLVRMLCASWVNAPYKCNSHIWFCLFGMRKIQKDKDDQYYVAIYSCLCSVSSVIWLFGNISRIALILYLCYFNIYYIYIYITSILITILVKLIVILSLWIVCSTKKKTNNMWFRIFFINLDFFLFEKEFHQVNFIECIILEWRIRNCCKKVYLMSIQNFCTTWNPWVL